MRVFARLDSAREGKLARAGAGIGIGAEESSFSTQSTTFFASASDAAAWSRASCRISAACALASERIQPASSTEPASQAGAEPGGGTGTGTGAAWPPGQLG